MHIAGRFWISLLVVTVVPRVEAQECVLSTSPVTLGEGELILYNGYDETAGTVTIQLVYEGLAWIGVGRSDQGEMIGGEVVIGIPDEVPAKYKLTAQAISGVNPMDAQTLISPTTVQNETHTILTYTKLMEEDGELSISPTEKQTWIWAYGIDNELTGHAKQNQVTFELTPCGSAGGGGGGGSTPDTTPAPAPGTGNESPTDDPPEPSSPSAPTETPPAAAPSPQSSSSTMIGTKNLMGTASLVVALLYSL
jgi:hypothetical protein